MDKVKAVELILTRMAVNNPLIPAPKRARSWTDEEIDVIIAKHAQQYLTKEEQSGIRYEKHYNGGHYD